MYKVSYMGNGTTKEFYFNFPYFESSNIIVTKNGAAATGFSVIDTAAAENANIPYTGGKVVFATAPIATDSITISRSLPLTRIVDYQPTAKIDPGTLNQDMTYTMEVLKDFKDKFDGFDERYAELLDNESIQTISAKIDTVTDQIVALGDISTLRSDVTTNTNNITNLKDAGNFTATGKAAIANMAMPSSEYIDLTLGASGSTYTAPADGWLNLRKVSGNASEYIELSGRVDAIAASGYSGQGLSVWIPVSKDENVTIWYNASGTTEKFRFIYANASN